MTEITARTRHWTKGVRRLSADEIEKFKTHVQAVMDKPPPPPIVMLTRRQRDFLRSMINSNRVLPESLVVERWDY